MEPVIREDDWFSLTRLCEINSIKNLNNSTNEDKNIPSSDFTKTTSIINTGTITDFINTKQKIDYCENSTQFSEEHITKRTVKRSH